MAETQMEFDRNPDGREHPIFFTPIIQKRDGTVVKKRPVRIVESNDQLLNYIAIDPQTQEEIELRATDWYEIYPSLLRKPPPKDLKKRVALYYKIRSQKANQQVNKVDKTAA